MKRLVAPAVTQPASTQEVDTIHLEDVIDVDQVMTQVGGDTELLAEIVSLFLEQSHTQLARIEEAISAGDGHGLERSAHSLKGSLATFHARRAHDAAYRLEALGKDRDLTLATDAYSALVEECERLRPRLLALVERAS